MCIRSIVIGCKQMIDDNLVVQHKHNFKWKVILTDSFSFDLLGRTEADISYKILDILHTIALVHDDRNKVYSCIKTPTLRKVIETYFDVILPDANVVNECQITKDDIDHHTFILAPLLSQQDLQKDEKYLDDLFLSRRVRFVLVSLSIFNTLI